MFCEVFSPGPCSPPARKLARFARCGRFAAAAAASRPLRPLRGRRGVRKKSCLNYPVNSMSGKIFEMWGGVSGQGLEEHLEELGVEPQ